MSRVTTDKIDTVKMYLSHIPKAVPKVIARAINRSAEAAATEMSRSVRDLYHINVKNVRSTISITKAKPSPYPMAWVKSKATRRPLIQFKVSPKNPRPKNPPAAVRVAVKRDSGLKALPGAFVNKGISSGMAHVLKRVGESRYPIRIKYGPSVPEMIGNPKVSQLVEQKAAETLEKRLDHEISRILEGNK